MPVLAACWLAGFAPSHGLHRPVSPEESPLRTSALGIEEPAPPTASAGFKQATPPTAPAGISDNLNYRYQLWQESDARPAFAPRFSLMLPSGDDEEGLGAMTRPGGRSQRGACE
jgi:hypothetical protein